MTIGIDLGDVWSHYCTLNEEGEVVDRGRFRTTPTGVERRTHSVYGAAATDVDTITTFVNGQGMSVVESHLGRRCVIVQGTAAQWNTAFGVALNQYSALLPQNTQDTAPNILKRSAGEL